MSGFKVLLSLGLTLNQKETVAYTVANGQTGKNIGNISTAIRLIEKIVILEILVVPDFFCHVAGAFVSPKGSRKK